MTLLLQTPLGFAGKSRLASSPSQPKTPLFSRHASPHQVRDRNSETAALRSENRRSTCVEVAGEGGAVLSDERVDGGKWESCGGRRRGKSCRSKL
nr:hypothetical protein Iba_chr07bCG4250 [Ipomoea batatas]